MVRKAVSTVLLSLTLASATACFVRTRHLTSPAASRLKRPPLNATKEQLIERVHQVSDPIRSFIMRADLSPSVLDPSKASVKDYAAVGAYVLFRRPANIRILGQEPMLGSTLFDMVSDDKEFRVSIPRKKLFIVGSNDAPATSQNKLENLRPDALLTSLVVFPPDPTTDFTILENDSERVLYILLVIRRYQDQFVLTRDIYFEGHTLQVIRQKTFDRSGAITSDTRYSAWKNHGSVSFPSEIAIQRPNDNYEVQVSVVSIRMNSSDVTESKFVLQQPPEAQLQLVK